LEEAAANSPYLSLVFPVFNQEGRLVKSLSEIIEFLSKKPFRSELILIEDCGQDRSLEILQDFERRSIERIEVVVFTNPRNRGKGYSVRKGVERARGRYIIFMDIDLAYSLEDIDRVLSYLIAGYDLSIACRTLPDSVYHISPSFFQYLYTRHLLSRLLNRAVRLWLGLAAHDTQAGLKGFARVGAQKIFGVQRLDRFSFDVEVLYLAKILGLRVKEVPVTFRYHNEPTTVHFVRDAIEMAYDLWRIRWWSWIGRYR